MFSFWMACWVLGTNLFDLNLYTLSMEHFRVRAMTQPIYMSVSIYFPPNSLRAIVFSSPFQNIWGWGEDGEEDKGLLREDGE